MKRFLGYGAIISVVFFALFLHVRANDPAILLHFNGLYTNSSHTSIPLLGYAGASAPTFSTTTKKFGSASLKLSKAIDQGETYDLTNMPAFGTSPFTIDLWVYPNSLYADQGFFYFYKTAPAGAKVNAFEFYRSDATYGPEMDLYNVTTNTWPVTKAAFTDLQLKQWNYVVFQRNADGTFQVAVNGHWSNAHDYGAVNIGAFDRLYIGKGWGWFQPFDGYIDEFRVTEGSNVWTGGTDFTPPQTPVTLVSPITASSSQTPTIAVQGYDQTVSGGGALPVSTTTTIFRTDNSLALSTIFVSKAGTNVPATTTLFAYDGTTKTAETTYDNGTLSKEAFFSPDGTSARDTKFYYPSGTISQEIIRRGGVEKLNKYNEDGKMVYSHIADGNTQTYRDIHTNAYNSAGQLTEDILYNAANDYTRTVSTYGSDGSLSRTETYQRSPDSPGTLVYSVSDVSGSTTTTRTYDLDAQTLLPTKVAVHGVAGGKTSYDDLFDYAADREQYTTYVAMSSTPLKDTTSAYQISDSLYLGYTKYAYRGDVLAQSAAYGNIDASGKWFLTKVTTDFASDGSKKDEFTLTSTIDKSGSVSAFATGFDGIYFDSQGNIAARQIETWSSSAPSKTLTDKGYSGAGLLLYDRSDFVGQWPKKLVFYDRNGTSTAETDYATTTASTYTATQYLVYKGIKIKQRTDTFTLPAGQLFPLPADVKTASSNIDRLAHEKRGESIAKALKISLPASGATAKEQAALYALATTSVTLYKTALSQIGSDMSTTSKAARSALYNDTVRDMTDAANAIAYNANPTLYPAGDDSLTYTGGGESWMGVDDTTGQDFAGIYLDPDGASMGSDKTAFIDLTDAAAVTAVLSKTNFAGLLTLPHKKERWDSYASVSPAVDANGNMYSYDVLAGNGSGAYIPIAEYAKADPSVMLLLAGFRDAMTKQGVDLTTVSETDAIRYFYKYFYSQSIISYLYDMGATDQMPGETIFRKGGNCKDVSILAFSLLRNMFLQLGNTDAADRVGMASVYVDKDAAISTTNPGISHAGIVYQDPKGASYYLESIDLFQGMNQTHAPFADADILTPISGWAGQNKVTPWYFKITAYEWANKAPEYAPGISAFGALQAGIPVVSTGNVVANKLENLPAYVTPLNPNVIVLTDYLAQYIPDLQNLSVSDIIEIVHGLLRSHMSYVADASGNDVWKSASTTIAAAFNGKKFTGSLQGDCADLSFVEASVMQQMLFRHYLARNMLPSSALYASTQNTSLVVEKRSQDTGDNFHVVVGAVYPAGKAQNTLIRIIDPQIDGVGKLLQYSAMTADDTYKAMVINGVMTGLRPTDWTSIELSSKVGNSAPTEPVVAANGASLAPASSGPPVNLLDQPPSISDAGKHQEETRAALSDLSDAVSKLKDANDALSAQQANLTDPGQVVQIDVQKELNQKEIDKLETSAAQLVDTQVATNQKIIDAGERGVNPSNYNIFSGSSGWVSMFIFSADIIKAGALANINQPAGDGLDNEVTIAATTAQTISRCITNIITALIPGVGGLISFGLSAVSDAILGSPIALITHVPATSASPEQYDPVTSTGDRDLGAGDSSSHSEGPTNCTNLCSVVATNAIHTKPANSVYVGAQHCSSGPVGSCNDTQYQVAWACIEGYAKSTDGTSCVSTTPTPIVTPDNNNVTPDPGPNPSPSPVVVCKDLCAGAKVITSKPNNSHYVTNQCSTSANGVCGDSTYNASWQCDAGYNSSSDGQLCVLVPPLPSPPGITLQLVNYSILKGDTDNLTWRVTGIAPIACTASASPADSSWNGSISELAGTRTVTPSAPSTSYTLNCQDKNGTSQKTVSVGVVADDFELHANPSGLSIKVLSGTVTTHPITITYTPTHGDITTVQLSGSIDAPGASISFTDPSSITVTGSSQVTASIPSDDVPKIDPNDPNDPNNPKKFTMQVCGLFIKSGVKRCINIPINAVKNAPRVQEL